MKALSEYTAEAMRRSAEIKRGRRARAVKAIGASCAAALVCVFGIAALSGLRSPIGGEAAPEETLYGQLSGTESVQEGAIGSADGAFVFAQLTFGKEEPIGIEDPKAIEALAGAIEAALDGASPDPLNDGASQYYHHLQEGVDAELTVKLCSADGQEAEYLIRKGELRRIDTEESFKISEESYYAIMEAAGALR